MLLLLATLFALATDGGTPPDTLASRQHPTAQLDSIHAERIDTLHEVVVRADSLLPVMQSVFNTWRQRPKQPPTLGDILEKYAPTVNDYILHPFGFKERKVQRQRKRRNRILHDYDHTKTFNELLDEAVRQQQLEDDLEKGKGSK